MKRFTVLIRSKMCVFPLSYCHFSPFFHSVFFAFGLVFSPVAVAHTVPAAADSVHFYKILDYEEIRARNSRSAATKHALNLNVGEPRTVRMIYFLPNDRPFRQEVVDSMKAVIRHVQTFFADQMEAHGHGRKTFRFETDAQGEPVVHRVDGQHWKEIEQKFNLSANVYCFVVDINSYSIGHNSDGAGVPGMAYLGKKNNGYALYSAELILRASSILSSYDGQYDGFAVLHELGHAFDLQHDWRDGDYIMSYGANGGRWDRLSACAAEFLSMHPYFNPDVPIEEGLSPIIELISPNVYPTGSTSVSIQLKASDPDGLHQVLLFHNDVDEGTALKACLRLNGETEAVVQFDYDGVIPNSRDPYGTGTSLSNPVVHDIYVEAVDNDGNVRSVDFTLFEISTQLNIITTLEGHTRGTNSIAFSPDGATLASGSYREVKLWDIVTRTNIATMEHTNWVNSIAFSPDGTMLASGSDDLTVKLWDVATRTNIATMEHTDRVNSIAFSPDGATLASGSYREVKLWDIVTRTNIATLEHTDRFINSIAFSPDGTTLASGTDREVKLWDVATRTNIATLAGHTGTVRSVAFSPDGTTLAPREQ